MKALRLFNKISYQLMFVMSVLAIIAAGQSHANTRTSDRTHINGGYSVLKLLLEDEQHLTFIRRTKSVLTFSSISDESRKLIDEIADTSDKALEQLELLAASKPGIEFQELTEYEIAHSTLDSMRMETAKDFLFSGDDFEKQLLVSQMQVLRVISHLAKELEEQEPNLKRKAWLNKLAVRYENYYLQVFSRLTVSA
jgi:hypothetical protein